MLDEIRRLDLDSLMRRALVLASQARANGNHPFGALLCDLEGKIVLEAENTVVTEDDVTRHAELNLMSLASRTLPEGALNKLVLVTSTEPCPMCAGAIFWTGVRAVVYGLPESALRAMCTSNAVPNPPVLNLPCKEVFAAARGHSTDVIGPILEAESRLVHEGFW